jgi:preprotein translocase SecE subunit
MQRIAFSEKLRTGVLKRIPGSFAMAVAVKNSPMIGPTRTMNPLAVGSLAGTAYVLVSLGIASYLIPFVWGWLVAPGLTSVVGPAVNASLLILVMLAVVAGLVYGGITLYRGLFASGAPLGLRAGVFTGVVGVLILALLTRWVGGILEVGFGERLPGVGVALTAAVGVVLLALWATLFFRASFDHYLEMFESQGWFTAAAYKKSQGQRVRRGTMLSILILAGCGIWALFLRSTLATGASLHWTMQIPFSGGRSIIVLPDAQYTLPIILAGISVWVSYRVIHFPAFADFLIATEAELNKVSWTTRKRLIQDTIVVLSTVVLLTCFLFIIDLGWYWLLSSRFVGVIQSGGTTANTAVVDRRIDDLEKERKQAEADNNSEKAKQIGEQIAGLREERNQIVSAKKGVPQDW